MADNMYIFDGSHLGCRAHFGMPTLTLNEYPIGAIFGVVKMLTSFVKTFPPGPILMPFDVSKSKYRLGLDPEYKGNRKKDPRMQKVMEAYYMQLGILFEILPKFGVRLIAEEARDWEADDAAAYIVSKFSAGAFPKVNQCILVSGDKDWASLVRPGVVWHDPLQHTYIKESNFKEVLGVEISQFPDKKALMGDAGDNVKNIRGLGEQGAIKLLNEYGSIANLKAINHKKIEGHWDVVDLARKLVAMDLHEQFPEDPVWGQIDAKIAEDTGFATENIEDMLTRLSFMSLLETWDDDKHRWEAFGKASLY